MSDLTPSIFCIQETKFKQTGYLQLGDYKIFESIRAPEPGRLINHQSGGGLALGCLRVLKPVWVRDGGDNAEALSVVINVKHMRIRTCVAYGC